MERKKKVREALHGDPLKLSKREESYQEGSGVTKSDLLFLPNQGLLSESEVETAADHLTRLVVEEDDAQVGYVQHQNECSMSHAF